MSYNPVFRTTSGMIKHLGKIEAARQIVENLDMPLSLERELRQEASIKMTHYSTKIEGNRLALKQTKEMLAGKDVIACEIDKYYCKIINATEETFALFRHCLSQLRIVL